MNEIEVREKFWGEILERTLSNQNLVQIHQRISKPGKFTIFLNIQSNREETNKQNIYNAMTSVVSTHSNRIIELYVLNSSAINLTYSQMTSSI